MKKSILAIALTAITFGSVAAEAENAEDINYGDPTASFSTLGVSTSGDKTQVNSMVGFGANIFQLDVTVDNKNIRRDTTGYRARYFHVTDGLGVSVDVLGEMGSKSSTTALAGLIYKIPLNDNVMIFPMLSLGYTDFGTPQPTSGENGDIKDGSVLYQGGIYAMYGFDAGHWLYANPKVTHIKETSANVPQVEVGGGYMVSDSVSLGFKVEYTAEYKVRQGSSQVNKADTVGWLQASYYF
ncbi:hypothetical protein BCU70_03490 [Vibrio sp. 10N.286.49.C2]|uniref:hypothetical protein n=1 Tax=unclassified Vibrio TaxID=2614977 RepID=UPI000C853AAB|nr:MULTISPECIES: hypothetical protein [unclassified Vibrio]PMH38344.1 hypothetical protein BCU70_03490 [Vibrio sp. 10N.286.49.C2]PMH55752.1 hypothetical protein BCU66_09085 [Vibrio sp. 10N.286.49.B1]PMH78166.1 hypothetical protein BCU58_10105 [Vibrio sp. 10N.286.48.B7]